MRSALKPVIVRLPGNAIFRNIFVKQFIVCVSERMKCVPYRIGLEEQLPRINLLTLLFDTGLFIQHLIQIFIGGADRRNTKIID